jgi:hypothetical protein
MIVEERYFTIIRYPDPHGTCLRCGTVDTPTLEATTNCGRMQGFPLCVERCLFAAAVALSCRRSTAPQDVTRNSCPKRNGSALRDAPAVPRGTAREPAGESAIGISDR